MTAVHEIARACKAGLLATAIVVVSVFAHVLAGGAAHLRSPLFLLSLLGVALTCFALPMRRWQVWHLVAFLAVIELVLHFAMVASSSGAAMGDMPMASPTTVSGSMLASHAGAVLVAAIIVRRGELLIDTLVSLLERTIPSLIVTDLPQLVERVIAPRSSAVVAALLAQRYQSSVCRRGPPLAVPTPRCAT